MVVVVVDVVVVDVVDVVVEVEVDGATVVGAVVVSAVERASSLADEQPAMTSIAPSRATRMRSTGQS
jgi:hypothetical protein